MKFQELKEWSENNLKKDNATLIAMGINGTKISKVRNILKEGLIVRCKMIMANEEKKGKYICEMENFIKQLKDYGLSFNQPATTPGFASTNATSEK